MDTEEIEKIRKDDIDFFSRRYAQLFGKHFGKITPEQIEEFYNEIKVELEQKAPKYVIVDNDPMRDNGGESYYDYINLSKHRMGDRALRIHELFHSYNHMGDDKSGLKDFKSNITLKNLNEGSTEMFAQMMCGNESKDVLYSGEVELTRFLTSIVGEGTMIRATRGNPKLLCEETDRLIGIPNFLQRLEKIQNEENELIDNSYEDGIGEDVKILSSLKLETLRNKDAVSVLFDAVEQSTNQDLYNKLIQADEKFGYNVEFGRTIRGVGKTDNQKGETLADVQQRLLKIELDELDNVEDISLQTVLEMEIKKYLYDKISFQKHFLNHQDPKFNVYELNSEDKEYSENFRSDLDGATERLGGRLGLVGPGNKIYSLDNTPYMVDENIAKKVYMPEVGFNELENSRLELWAEKLNIAQTKELLNQWNDWIYNAWYKNYFQYEEGDELFKEAVDGIKNSLEEKENGLVEKYKLLEGNQKNNNNEEITSNIEPEIQPTQDVEDTTLDDSKESNKKEKSIDLWKKRFSRCYGIVDRVSSNVKTKYLKMKLDIIEAISDKTNERSNNQEVDKNDEIDI